MPAAVRRIALPMYTVVDGVNRWAYARRRGFATPIPPPNLRARTGARFIGRFIESGGSCAAALEASLAAATGASVYDHERILDFGCGCGRTLLHWDAERLSNFVGCDVDRECIAWLADNFPALHFYGTSFDPPLPFEEGAFDLIYSVSIFSHLARVDQILWLEELRRVLRPGGIALVTVQGEHAVRRFKELDPALRRDANGRSLSDDGFVFFPYMTFQPGRGELRGISSPDREVQYGLTFMSRSYIEREWLPAGLEFLRLDEGTVDDLQDVVVVRKR